MSGLSEAAAPAPTSGVNDRAMHDIATVDRAQRAAAAVFGVIIVFGAVLFLWAGRDEWFNLDGWDYLANRAGGDLGWS